MPAWNFRCVYGVAHFGKSLLWHTSQILFAYVLTEAHGFSPYGMGMILTGTLLLNAVADLAAGQLLARLASDLERIRRVQACGTLLSCLGLVIAAASAIIGAVPQPALGISGLVLFGVAYAIVDVPQNAILGLAFQDQATRTAMSATRLFLSGGAQFVVVLAFVPLMRGLDAGGLAERFLAFSLAISCVACCAALWLGRTPLELPPPAAKHDAACRTDGPAGLSLGLLLVMMALFTLTTASVVKLEPYVASFWFEAASDGVAYMTAIAIGSMAAQPLWTWRARTRSHVSVLRQAALALALGGLSFQLASAGVVAATVSGLIFGAGLGGVTMLLWSLLAETSQSAPNRATTTFGLFTFVAKAAGAASALLISHALEASHYSGPEADLTYLALFITLVPALGAAGLIGLSCGRRGRSRLHAPFPSCQKRRPSKGPALPATHPRELPSGSQS